VVVYLGARGAVREIRRDSVCMVDGDRRVLYCGGFSLVSYAIGMSSIAND
jgi:hypothetical protein